MGRTLKMPLLVKPGKYGIMESGRNFRQLLMFCAEDAFLTVLSGLNPALTDDQIREEIMMCFSLAPTRRQALERLRAMHQETVEQMW